MGDQTGHPLSRIFFAAVGVPLRSRFSTVGVNYSSAHSAHVFAAVGVSYSASVR